MNTSQDSVTSDDMDVDFIEKVKYFTQFTVELVQCLQCFVIVFHVGFINVDVEQDEH